MSASTGGNTINNNLNKVVINHSPSAPLSPWDPSQCRYCLIESYNGEYYLQAYRFITESLGFSPLDEFQYPRSAPFCFMQRFVHSTLLNKQETEEKIKKFQKTAPTKTSSGFPSPAIHLG